MTTSAQLKEAIAKHLEYQSNWRAQKAEEHPEDDRNRIVADALAKAADQVRLLPDSDWNRFARLAKLADDRSIDANTLLSFSDETGEDVTSALHYGNEPGGYRPNREEHMKSPRSYAEGAPRESAPSRPSCASRR
jgi:hypothetical protein